MPTYFVTSSLVSAYGIGTDKAFEAILQEQSAIKAQTIKSVSPSVFYSSSIPEVLKQQLNDRFLNQDLSMLEMLSVAVVENATLQFKELISLPETIFVFSSTKGNIEWLGQQSEERINLHTSAKKVVDYFNNPNKPIVVSTACVSGCVAALMAKRLLDAAQYKHAIVLGVDLLCGFVHDGFAAFQAIDNAPCRPFDSSRNGINLGEAAACMILSSAITSNIVLSAGATGSDATHLSAPSRTGEELALTIKSALQEAQIEAKQIDMISAHGTGTLYNDEMESKALALCGLSATPTHSLKSYVGHTFGAAGLIESIMVCKALQANKLIASLNFSTTGTPEPVLINKHTKDAKLNHVLKTASGFGGSNAALIWSKK